MYLSHHTVGFPFGSIFLAAGVFLCAAVSPWASARLEPASSTAVPTIDPIIVPISEDVGSPHSHRRSSPVVAGACHITQTGLLERCETSDVDARGSLYLGSRGITAIHAGAFDELTSLYNLNIRDNYIEHIEPGAFDGLSNLEVLRLSENQLSSIEEGLFEGLSSVEELYLYNNQIASLDSGDFNGLRSLRKLFLQHNEIVVIDSRVFDGTPNLEELRLEYNPVLENALIKELDWDSDLHALQFVDQKSPGMCYYITSGRTPGGLAGESCNIVVEGWYTGCCGSLEEGNVDPDSMQCCVAGGASDGTGVALFSFLSTVALAVHLAW